MLTDNFSCYKLILLVIGGNMPRNLIRMHLRKFELIWRVNKSRANEGSLRDRVLNNIYTLDQPFQVICLSKSCLK